jgi:hypothetical protein
MADEIARCPYCVLSDGFRPMLQRPSWLVCDPAAQEEVKDGSIYLRSLIR